MISNNFVEIANITTLLERQVYTTIDLTKTWNFFISLRINGVLGGVGSNTIVGLYSDTGEEIFKISVPLSQDDNAIYAITITSNVIDGSGQYISVPTGYFTNIEIRQVHKTFEVDEIQVIVNDTLSFRSDITSEKMENVQVILGDTDNSKVSAAVRDLCVTPEIRGVKAEEGKILKAMIGFGVEWIVEVAVYPYSFVFDQTLDILNIFSDSHSSCSGNVFSLKAQNDELWFSSCLDIDDGSDPKNLGSHMIALKHWTSVYVQNKRINMVDYLLSVEINGSSMTSITHQISYDPNINLNVFAAANKPADFQIDELSISYEHLEGFELSEMNVIDDVANWTSTWEMSFSVYSLLARASNIITAWKDTLDHQNHRNFSLHFSAADKLKYFHYSAGVPYDDMIGTQYEPALTRYQWHDVKIIQSPHNATYVDHTLYLNDTVIYSVTHLKPEPIDDVKVYAGAANPAPMRMKNYILEFIECKF